jgi:hypothetical protein
MKKNKIKCIDIIASIILLGLFAFIIFLALSYQEKHKIFGYIMSILSQLIVGILLLYALIPISMDKNCKEHKAFAFLTNMMFSISTTMLVIVNTVYNEIWFQIISLLSLSVILYFVNKLVDVKKDSDIHLLKATNYFMIALLYGVIFLLGKHCVNEKIKDLLDYYYLLPLFMIQGLYELLDKKKENAGA